MNVYQKLNQARMDLQSKELKKSGKNAFSKYPYFELGDILPTINQINDLLGITAAVSFTQDAATMTITNSENPDEQIIFTSPMGSAELKGCHVVQNIGACETYQRRYLYFTAYEITEHDALEENTGNPKQGKNDKPKPGPTEPTDDEKAKEAARLDTERKTLIAEYTTKVRKLKGDAALDIQAYFQSRHGLSIYEVALGALKNAIKKVDADIVKAQESI